MLAADIESLERATLAAVPPRALEELGGWLLGFDAGTVGRAHSAVPLRHQAPAPGTVGRIVQRYAAQGLAAVLRVPRVGCFDALRSEIEAGGWRAGKPTLTQTGSAAALARLPGDDRRDAGLAEFEVVLRSSIDDDWAAVFLGAGFDPVDGASRLEILGRSRDTLFASVRVQGEVVAVGSACFACSWVGVHGMRTAPGWRRRGAAAHILSAFGREGQARSVERVFLQVEEANAGAQRLYSRAGLQTAWTYAYWQLV